MTPIPLADLFAGLDVVLAGPTETSVAGLAACREAGPTDLTFLSDAKLVASLADRTFAGLVTTGDLAAKLGDVPYAVAITDDPRGVFLELAARVRPRRPRPEIGVSKAAEVHPTATIGPDTNIHPRATIGPHVVIGRGCDVHPGVTIGAGCVLGDGVVLHPGVVLYDDVTLEDRVIAHANVVIGGEGFGYETRDGRHERLTHHGTVRVEEDVEIGAGSTIDRAMFGETVIGAGTKIDNLVMVAHNCRVGRHNFLVGQCGLAGSVTTGEYTIVAGHSGVADHVTLGDRVRVASMSGAHRDIPDDGVWGGTPAVPMDELRKLVFHWKKLGDMRAEIKKLTKEVEALKSAAASDEAPRAAA